MSWMKTQLLCILLALHATPRLLKRGNLSNPEQVAEPALAMTMSATLPLPCTKLGYCRACLSADTAC